MAFNQLSCSKKAGIKNCTDIRTWSLNLIPTFSAFSQRLNRIMTTQSWNTPRWYCRSVLGDIYSYCCWAQTTELTLLSPGTVSSSTLSMAALKASCLPTLVRMKSTRCLLLFTTSCWNRMAELIWSMKSGFLACIAARDAGKQVAGFYLGKCWLIKLESSSLVRVFKGFENHPKTMMTDKWHMSIVLADIVFGKPFSPWHNFFQSS